MEIPNSLTQKLIDHREAKPKVLKQSIIDYQTQRLRELFNDESLDSRFVAKLIQKLSEKDIEDLADYCLRKARNPGRAFVKLCANVMDYRTLPKA